MDERAEMCSVLATLSNGLWVTSVVIDDLPLARHLYRVMGPNGAIISEHAALSGLADFLARHNADLIEPHDDLGPDAARYTPKPL